MKRFLVDAVSSGGVSALVLGMFVRGGIAVEVGRAPGRPCPCAGMECRGCAGLGAGCCCGWGCGWKVWSTWRLRMAVPGISESSEPGRASGPLRFGFMMRLGAPPEPTTSG